MNDLQTFAAARPLEQAVERISAKTPVGSILRSAEWENVPLALRERAQFSAGVESVRVLQAIQDRLEGQIQLQKENLADGIQAEFDRSSFIDAIRDIARDEGLTPEDPAQRGGLQDITSIPRLGLIYDTQVGLAQGFARWKLDQSEGALLLFPAQEFVRVEDRKVPRDDWPRRFAEAAKAVGDAAALDVQRETGRMIALKTSGLWASLSRFGTPWPPMDFGSGMGFEDIDRDEAISLGLITEDQTIAGEGEKDFNDRLQASVTDLDDDSKSNLKKFFGDKVRFEKDTVWWKGDRKGKKLTRPEPEPAPEPGPEPLPPPAPAGPAPFPETLGQVEHIRALGGSTGATLVRDRVTGEKFVLKRGNSAAHVREEFTADQLYRAAGVPVPEAKLFDEDGRPTKLARYIEGQPLSEYLRNATPEARAAVTGKLQEHFPVDALLGNWDVAGLNLDNIIVDAAGVPWRIDNGGSLRYRAQGTAKTAEEWNAFPTELWSLRNSQTNAQTAQLFGTGDFYALAKRIEQLDGAALLAAAPDELKQLLTDRLGHLKDAGRKALEYQTSRFTAPHADHVTEQIIGLRKAGLVEKLPERLKQGASPVTFLDDAGKAFDDLRFHGPHSAPAEPPDKTTQIFNPILLAAKTVNHHHGGSSKFNQGKVDAALALKPQLLQLAGSGSADEKKMAAHYLGAISSIEGAIEAGTKVPELTKFPLSTAKADAPAAPGQSTVQRLAAHMQQNGGDWEIVKEWASDQAGNSRNPKAVAKKRWLLDRLVDTPAKEFHLPPKTERLAAERQRWGEKYDRTWEIFHAFMQEMLGRTEFSGNDPKARLVRIIRTERNGAAVPFAKGEWGTYKRGVNESGSIATPFSSGALTVTIVPHTQVTSSYFLERTPGKGGDLLLGDSENEFTYMAHGLKALHVGSGAAISSNAGSDHQKWPKPPSS